MLSSNGAPLKIVILGCGRVGSTLARQLSLDGHSVVIIDLTKDAFRRLGTKFQGQRVVGTGLELETLRKAGAAEADVFIAVTQGDNTNIMAAQVAREVFSIDQVIARIYDPIRAQAYRDLGINTLCTTTLAAAVIRSSLQDGTQRESWQDKLEGWDKAYLDLVDK